MVLDLGSTRYVFLSYLKSLAPFKDKLFDLKNDVDEDLSNLATYDLQTFGAQCAHLLSLKSGENDEDWMTRVEVLYKTHVGGDFKHKSAWLFLKGKHKWTNPESTNARRSRFRVTDEEPEHFGDDALPRPPGLQQIAKSQRSGSNSTASSGSNPMMYQEFTKEQYELDRKAKMQVIEQKSEERRQLIQSQRIVEDMKMLQINTSRMDPVDAAIINAQKARIRAAYPPPPN
nr:hypothetical protein [Tanacetum cinerariifolium]